MLGNRMEKIRFEVEVRGSGVRCSFSFGFLVLFIGLVFGGGLVFFFSVVCGFFELFWIFFVIGLNFVFFY